MELAEIREDLKDIRYYYARKDMFSDSIVIQGVAVKVIKDLN